MEHLIISPHIDDAWFDLGGTINKWRQAGQQVLVIDVFSVQCWTKNGISTATDITSIRKNEEALNAYRDQVQVEFLDLPESLIRGYNLNFPQVIDWSVDCNTLDLMISLLRKKTHLSTPNHIYFPLGIGGHVDHLITRELYVHLDKILNNGVKVGFYEDLPYASEHTLPFEFISQVKLTPVLKEIDINHKLMGLRSYNSQVDERAIQKITNYAYTLENNGQPYERIWVQ